MAAAVLCARLYAETGDSSYLTRLRATARGIKRYETLPSGSAFAARDARVAGWAAVFYAREVAPLIRASAGAFGDVDIAMTGFSVMTLDRSDDGTFGGSWGGPADGSDPWSAKGLRSQQVEISANAAIWAIAALATP